MTDFVQGQLPVRFRFGILWPMLEIFRKLYFFAGSCRLLRRLFDYARGSTQNGKKNKNTSRIYDLGVVPTRGNKQAQRKSIVLQEFKATNTIEQFFLIIHIKIPHQSFDDPFIRLWIARFTACLRHVASRNRHVAHRMSHFVAEAIFIFSLYPRLLARLHFTPSVSLYVQHVS